MNQQRQLYTGHISLTCFPRKNNRAGRHPVTTGHPARLLQLEFGAKNGLNVREVVEVKKSRIVIQAYGWLRPGFNLGADIKAAAKTLCEAAAFGYLAAYKTQYRVGNVMVTGTQLVKELTKAGQVQATAIIAVPHVQAERIFGVQA
jgi:hypothetical protein